MKNKFLVSDGVGEDFFIFEVNEVWKDFYSSFLRFYENGEFCDVILKVRLFFFIFINFVSVL